MGYPGRGISADSCSSSKLQRKSLRRRETDSQNRPCSKPSVTCGKRKVLSAKLLSTPPVGKVLGEPPCAETFSNYPAYRLVGFQTKKHYFHADSPLNINPIRTTILDDLSVRVRAAATPSNQVNLVPILINERIMAKVKNCRPRMSATGQLSGLFCSPQRRSKNILIACRLKSESPLQILDYYVIPSGAELKGSYHVGKRNNPVFGSLSDGHFTTSRSRRLHVSRATMS